MSHTPGPWRIEKYWSNGCEVGPWIRTDKKLIASVCGAPYLGDTDTYANAELIARAPDLLADVERLTAERDAAVAMLRRIQWDSSCFCHECHWSMARGHAPGCELAAILAKHPAPGAGEGRE